MKVYLSHASIGPSLRPAAPGSHGLVLLAHEMEFSGVALSDREIGALPESDIERIASSAAERDLGIVVDANADLVLADPEARRRELSHLESMLDLAERLGARRMRIAVGGQRIGIQRLLKRGRSGRGQGAGRLRRVVTSRPMIRWAHTVRSRVLRPPRADQESTDLCVEALRRVADRAQALGGVRLGIENHWGVTTYPEDVVQIVRDAASEHLGTCPDFANFPRGVGRHQGLSALAPYAVLAHARSSRFNVEGEERTIDYGRCLRILRDAGFDGVLCVEYLGHADPIIAVQKARDLIERHWNCLESAG